MIVARFDYFDSREKPNLMLGDEIRMSPATNQEPESKRGAMNLDLDEEGKKRKVTNEMMENRIRHLSD